MEWPELDHGVFAISVAAQLSGLHPQTLRIYEREGLVEPGRSAGGTRLYSGGDVTRLREIAALIDGGLNIAGIKRVLELQEEVRRLQAEVERLSAEVDEPTPARPSGRARSMTKPRDLARVTYGRCWPTGAGSGANRQWCVAKSRHLTPSFSLPGGTPGPSSKAAPRTNFHYLLPPRFYHAGRRGDLLGHVRVSTTKQKAHL